MSELHWEEEDSDKLIVRWGEDTIIINKNVDAFTIPGHKIRRLVSTTPRSSKYQKLGVDYSIKIPPELAEKLQWEIGSDIYISAYDEDLKQAIIGKRLKGEEFKQGLRKLRQQVAKDIESDKAVSE